jgi:hypothetical protein
MSQATTRYDVTPPATPHNFQLSCLDFIYFHAYDVQTMASCGFLLLRVKMVPDSSPPE